MAIVQGKPGRYARSEADKRMTWFAIVVLLLGVGLGLLGGLSMAWRTSLSWWSAVVGSMITLYFAAPFWLHKPLTILGRQRVKFMRGAQG